MHKDKDAVAAGLLSVDGERDLFHRGGTILHQFFQHNSGIFWKTDKKQKYVAVKCLATFKTEGIN